MKLTPGYGFHLLDDGSWKVEEIPSSVLYSAKESGTLRIEGFPSRVFETPDGDMWAQKDVVTASGSVWQRPVEESAKAEIERFCKVHGLDGPSAVDLFSYSSLQKLGESAWYSLKGDSYYQVDGLEEAREVAEEDSRDIETFLSRIGSGQKIDAPIILKTPDGDMWVVDGSTRLLAARALNLYPQVLVIDMTKFSW